MHFIRRGDSWTVWSGAWCRESYERGRAANLGSQVSVDLICQQECPPPLQCREMKNRNLQPQISMCLLLSYSLAQPDSRQLSTAFFEWQTNELCTHLVVSPVQTYGLWLSTAHTSEHVCARMNTNTHEHTHPYVHTRPGMRSCLCSCCLSALGITWRFETIYTEERRGEHPSLAHNKNPSPRKHGARRFGSQFWRVANFEFNSRGSKLFGIFKKINWRIFEK